ncbi:hypothetical protein KKD61_05545 [Patescibacteria group bacterium]|nr:hypothetical protein [Patescibacteria group bacterium]
MNKGDFIIRLYKQNQTVFTIRELSLTFPSLSEDQLKNRLSYYARRNRITRLRRGVYAKENFNKFELANKIYTPSYISFETVLRKEGIIFQENSTVFAAGYLTRKIKCSDFEISYRKIKNEVLTNSRGVEKKNNYHIASRERAFLDTIFVYKNYYFDNLSVLSWEKVFDLSGLYKSKALKKRLNQYYKIYREENAQ